MRVCVYCGSSPGARPAYLEAARRTGERLGAGGHALVYGGASVGLMGAVADAALAAGAEVRGVLPRALADRELAHGGLTELHVVGSMHERKRLMADLSDAFVALPGGIGTFEELFEVWTWTQLGFHAKPVGLLDVEGYYAPLVAFLDRATAEGFVKPVHRDVLVVDEDPEALLARLAAAELPDVPKWIGRGER